MVECRRLGVEAGVKHCH